MAKPASNDDADGALDDEELDTGEEGTEEEEGTGAEGEGEGGEGAEGEQKKKKSVEELQEELDTIRLALKKANRESAKRRLKIKELESSSKPDEGTKTEVEKLQSKLDDAQKLLVDLQTENTGLKLRGTIRSKAAEMKLSFYSDDALEDAAVRVQAKLSEIEDYDDEDVVIAIKEVAKARPYLFRKPEKTAEGNGSGTDAAKTGKSDIIVTEDEEKEIARRFNIKS